MGEPVRKLDEQLSTYSEVDFYDDMQGIFQDQHYNIQQPFFQIRKEKYHIKSQNNSEEYFAFRHRRVFRKFIAKSLGIGAFVVIFILSVTLLAPFSQSQEANSPEANKTLFFLVMAVMAIAYGICISIIKFLSPKRKITLHAQDDKKSNSIFEIMPTSGFFLFNHEYHLIEKGQTVLKFKKKLTESIFRTRWHVYGKDDQYLFTAMEDNLVLATLRRIFNEVKIIPINFVLNKNGGKSFAKLTRKWSFRDKYKLEHDAKAIPSWIVLAMALVLDTGEMR